LVDILGAKLRKRRATRLRSFEEALEILPETGNI
jgi:hypothetical protein